MGLSVADMLFTYRADISDLADKMSSAKSDMQSVTAQAQSTGDGIQGGFGMGIQGIVDFGAKVGMTIMGIQNVARTAMSIGDAIISPAANAETTVLAFETVLKSASQAKTVMQDLNTYAASTPLQTQWVDNAAEKILAFGGTVGSIQPEINAIGDTLSGLGKLSDSSLNSIVDIFGKISAQGKITGGDMMQLSTWGIPAWQALSSSMGLPIPQLQKMVSSGLIPASKALPALEQGMEKTFGGGMAKQAQTFTGLMSTLASNWQIAMAAMGGPALKLAETALTGMGNVLSSPAFQNFATGAGQEIANVLGAIGTAVSTTVGPAFSLFMKDFVNDEPIGIFLGIFQNLGDIFKSAYSILKSLSPTFAIFVDIFKNFDAKNALVTAVNDFISAVYKINAITGDASNLIGAFANWLQKGGLPAQVFKDALIGIGVAMGVIKAIAIANAIADFISILPIVIGLTWFWVAGLTAAAVEMVIATWPIIAIGAAIAIVVTIIILAVQHWGDIVKWLQGAWANTVSFFQGVWAGIVSIFQGIDKWFSDRWSDTAKGAQSAWNGIVAFFQGIWAKITGFFGGIGNWFHDRFGEAADGAQSGWSKAASFFGGIGNWFHDRGKDASNGLQSGWQDAVKAASVMAHGIVDAGKWLYDHDIYVHSAVDATKAGLKSANDWIVNAWNVTVHAIQAAWTWVATGAVSIWNTVTTAIKDAAMVAWTFLVSVWTTATTWLAARWQWVSAQAQAIWHDIVFVVEAALYLAWMGITFVWTAATTWLHDRWVWVSAQAQAIWTVIYNVIQTALSAVWTFIVSIWTTATTWLSVQWGKLAGLAGVAWSAVSAVFGNIWTTYISAPLASLWASITGWWGNLVKSAQGLGGDFMTQLAAGIANGVGIIGQALHNTIASAMWDIGLRNIPGWVGGTVPGVASHASGIIDNPMGHVGWVGENGPELMYVPKGASIFPTGSSLSYPIKPSAIGVQGASSSQASSSGASTGGQTLIFQVDTQQLARMTNTATNKIVMLKLGPKGVSA